MTLFFGFIAFLLGFIIFFLRRDFIGTVWLAFNLLCGVWATGYAFQINNDVAYPTALLMTRIADGASVLIPVTWLHFVYLFVGSKIRKSLLISLYSISVAIASTAPTGLLISRLKDKSNIGLVHFADAGPTFHFLTLLFVILVGASFAKLVVTYFKPGIDSQYKKRVAYLIFASMLGYGGGCTAFLPVYDIDLPILYGALVAPFFPLLMAFGFSRYNMLGLEEVAEIAYRGKLAALGMLSARINHELRSPLYIIQNSAATFLSEKDDSQQPLETKLKRAADYFSKSLVQSEKAMGIIKRFSLFARQKVEGAPKREPLRVESLLLEVVSLLKNQPNFEKIRIESDIPENLPKVLADGHFLQEIFQNLLNNAAEAMSQGGRVELTVRRVNREVKVTISDTGSGIPANQLHEVFQPFYSTHPEGMGLGLFITKQLVERMGGKITVEPRQGKGATFVVSFPIPNGK